MSKLKTKGKPESGAARVLDLDALRPAAPLEVTIGGKQFRLAEPTAARAVQFGALQKKFKSPDLEEQAKAMLDALTLIAPEAPVGELLADQQLRLLQFWASAGKEAGDQAEEVAKDPTPPG